MVKCKKKGLDFYGIDYDKESISDIPDDLGLFDEGDRWSITIEGGEIKGKTFMTNFNMENYFRYLKINISIL